MTFEAYDGFVAWRVEQEVSVKYFDVMPIMAYCGLWYWEYYEVKPHGNVVLIMVIVLMVEWSPFLKESVVSWLCAMIVEN